MYEFCYQQHLSACFHWSDGRQWSCQLQEEIEASCSRVQYKEKGGFLHVIMQKKIPFHIWPSLKVSGDHEGRLFFPLWLIFLHIYSFMKYVIWFELLVFTMVFLLCTLLQSNKKEKEAAPPETKYVKELALDSSEKSKPSSSQPHLQPQPPSSPAPGESKRSGGKGERGAKRCLKNKAACDKAATDSVGGKGGAGDGSATTGKPATVTTGEQQPQEPSAKRTIVRPPKTTK